MKFKFDQIEIDLKIKKSAGTTKAYQITGKNEIRMHKVSQSVSR